MGVRTVAHRRGSPGLLQVAVAVFVEPGSQFGGHRAQVFGSAAQKRRDALHGVGAAEDRLRRIGTGVHPSGDCQREVVLAVEDRERVQPHRQLCGTGEHQVAFVVEGLEVEVRLVEAVEHHHTGCPRVMQPRHERGHRGVEGRELHRHRDVDRVDDRGHHLQLALFDGGPGERGVGGHVVEVQLQCRCSMLRDLVGVVGPSARAYPVEGSEHRHLERLGQALQMLEGRVRTLGEHVGVDHERARLGVDVDRGVQQALGGELVGDQLLLEQRVHHHGSRAGLDERLGILEAVAQR